jgi:hypothetical protein
MVAAFLLVALPSSGRANGDPASDVLLTQDVYFPYPAPRKDVAAGLDRAVAAVYVRHLRIKVAVIASPTDLGSVPTLFNKSMIYARFLGTELDSTFVGPLLIVMPAGFGVYDGGRPIAAEERALRGLEIVGASAEALTSAATIAVKRLTAANALQSKDIRGPSVYAEVATATTPGQRAKIRYTVVDDSERSREIVRVFRGSIQIGLIKTPLRAARARRPHTVVWRLPKRRPRTPMHYCVVAIDPAGNVSSKACALIFVVRTH